MNEAYRSCNNNVDKSKEKDMYDPSPGSGERGGRSMSTAAAGCLHAIS